MSSLVVVKSYIHCQNRDNAIFLSQKKIYHVFLPNFLFESISPSPLDRTGNNQPTSHFYIPQFTLRCIITWNILSKILHQVRRMWLCKLFTPKNVYPEIISNSSLAKTKPSSYILKFFQDVVSSLY